MGRGQVRTVAARFWQSILTCAFSHCPISVRLGLLRVDSAFSYGLSALEASILVPVVPREDVNFQNRLSKSEFELGWWLLSRPSASSAEARPRVVWCAYLYAVELTDTSYLQPVGE